LQHSAQPTQRVNSCTVKAYPSHAVPTDDGALPWKVLRLLNVHLVLSATPTWALLLFFFSDLITCLPWHRELLKSAEELQQNN